MSANTNVAAQQKTLDYIKRSGALIAEAEKQAAAQEQLAAKVEKLIPAAVDALIENGRIPEDLREKAAASLRDHAKAIEVLASVAAHRNDAELNHMGTAVKTAGARSQNPYVGGRQVEERESDLILLQRLGIR